MLFVLFIAGLIAMSCNQEDINNPKKTCPNLLGEWWYSYFIDFEVLNDAELNNEDTLLNNITSILEYIDENYEELVNEVSPLGDTFDFRENGEVVASGRVLNFKCLSEKRFRLSDSDFEEETLEYRIIYEDVDVIFVNAGNFNQIWFRR